MRNTIVETISFFLPTITGKSPRYLISDVTLLFPIQAGWGLSVSFLSRVLKRIKVHIFLWLFDVSVLITANESLICSISARV